MPQAGRADSEASTCRWGQTMTSAALPVPSRGGSEGPRPAALASGLQSRLLLFGGVGCGDQGAQLTCQSFTVLIYRMSIIMASPSVPGQLGR